jgi:hypothetical protein
VKIFFSSHFDSKGLVHLSSFTMDRVRNVNVAKYYIPVLTSGTSAPSSTFPDPSMTLYVGMRLPSPVTLLKKDSFETMGDLDDESLRWPWAFKSFEGGGEAVEVLIVLRTRQTCRVVQLESMGD